MYIIWLNVHTHVSIQEEQPTATMTFMWYQKKKKSEMRTGNGATWWEDHGWMRGTSVSVSEVRLSLATGNYKLINIFLHISTTLGYPSFGWLCHEGVILLTCDQIQYRIEVLLNSFPLCSGKVWVEVGVSQIQKVCCKYPLMFLTDQHIMEPQ